MTNAISWVESVVLGIVQGLTEFLPISSTAHLRIVPELAWGRDPGAAMSAVIQLGTMAAVVVFFRRDLVRIVSAWLRTVVLRKSPASDAEKLDTRMGWFIVLGTVPIGVAGLLFKDAIETSLRDLRIIALALIVLGIIMWAADRWMEQRKSINDLTLGSAMTFGVAQALALVPGVSRSGATITAGRLLGFSREAAARYSFLLSIPAVVLSGAYEAATASQSVAGDAAIAWPQTLLATAIAFVVGYAAIAWLLKWLSTHSTALFAAYRVALGIVVLVLVQTGALAPLA